MQNAFAKLENVLKLAGIALANVALLVSARQYAPTLHLSKTSFWSGTKVAQIRFESYPDTGLIELGRAEALARAGTWDTWAFGLLAGHPTDPQNVALLVEAGNRPGGNIVRIIQEIRSPDQVLGFVGRPRFVLLIEGKPLPVEEADVLRWQGLLFKGIKLAGVADNWNYGDSALNSRGSHSN
jgi:hypothetical protein